MGEAGFRLLQAHGVNGLQEEPIHESASCPGWLYFWLPGIFKNPFPLTFPPKARPIAVQTLCSPSSGTWAESIPTLSACLVPDLPFSLPIP